jgi:hypothetical protein
VSGSRYFEGVPAAWRLFLRDGTAIADFDASPAGVRRSFIAAVTTLPVYALLVAVGPDAVASPRPWPEVVAIHAAFYVYIWTVWPLVMNRAAGLLDRGIHYPRFLAAYNWSMVIQAGLWLAVFLWAAVFTLSPGMVHFLTIFAVAIVLLYHIFILKTALALPIGPAVALALFKFVLYQIILGLQQGVLA